MAGRPMYRAGLIELQQLGPVGVQKLLDRIANGDRTKDIATEEGYTTAALMAFLSSPDHRQSLLDARARAATLHAEETLAIADNGADSRAPDPARDKLRIQSRQWLASRWDRATYGESRGPSVEVNIGGMFLDAMRSCPQPVDTAPVAIIEAQPVSEPPVTQPLG